MQTLNVLNVKLYYLNCKVFGKVNYTYQSSIYLMEKNYDYSENSNILKY